MFGYSRDVSWMHGSGLLIVQRPHSSKLQVAPSVYQVKLEPVAELFILTPDLLTRLKHSLGQ